MKLAVPYYRVSTTRQGISGLGLEAQRKAVEDYAIAFQLQLLNGFIEIESGRNKKRPIMKAALDLCKKQKAILLIAKLDRLSRNVAFVSKLMESGVEFVAVDNPHASKLIIHILSAFSEFEADAISSRTKDALQAAKRKGRQLGRYGRDVLSKKNHESAMCFARKMNPIILGLNKEGYRSVREITSILNSRGIEPYSGKTARWHVTTVCKLLHRLKDI